VKSVDNLLIRYLVPFLITFVLFLIVFHWIPEKKVSGRSALIAAFISAVLWETVKRIYTYYLINVSLIGKIEGPIIAIIMFGFWMEVSMGIMLYGAKLTYLLDKGAE
jgi:membrane protein